MRVLLTGGYGCIGSWIVRHLIERGDQAWVYDLRRDEHRLALLLGPEQLAQVGFVAGDVADQGALNAALRSHQITHVVHLAGLQVPVCRADPVRGAHVNVLGTLAVFEAIRQSVGQVRGLVYASSAAVFGPPDQYASGRLGDDVPLAPTTHYGVFKSCNEGNARVYFADHGLSSIGLRPWTVFGVGRDFGMTSEPTRAIQALALGRRYHISYGGWQDFQFVDDVARAFIRCLEASCEGARVYNLRGEVVDMAAFLRTLVAVEPAAANLITHGDRQLTIAYDLDDTALQHEVGGIPHTPLRDGIRQTYLHFARLRDEGRLDAGDLAAQ